jgi:MFS family permease
MSMIDALKSRLPASVVALGWVSFLNELSSQIVAPLIPLLLATVLGAGPVALGVIEGFADAVASLLKLWAGRRSDSLGQRRKSFIVGGYALSVVARPLIGLALGWPMVLLLRSLDQAGKGLRGAPRDALVADATPKELQGRAFGINRAFDYAGAVGGSLIAAAALTYVSDKISSVIFLSVIPGVVAVLLLAFAVQNSPSAVTIQKQKVVPPLRWSALSAPSRRFLAVLIVFSCSRVSESFILLRAHELGMSTVTVLLLWASLCAIQAGVAWAGGSLSDRFSKTTVVALTWLSYGAGLILIAGVQNPVGLWIAVAAYALLTGMGEGAGKALVSELATDADRGTAFGWYNMIVGLAAIPAGLLFGAIWSQAAAGTAFAVFGGLGIASAALVLLSRSQELQNTNSKCRCFTADLRIDNGGDNADSNRI